MLLVARNMDYYSGPKYLDSMPLLRPLLDSSAHAQSTCGDGGLLKFTVGELGLDAAAGKRLLCCSHESRA